MGVFRHLAILSEHLDSSTLIVLVGYAFATMFLYRVRRIFLEWLSEKRKMIGIHTYADWAFASIIGAIIFLAGTVGVGLGDKIFGILLLSISAFVVYLIHPGLGLLFAIRNRIHPSTSCPKCKKEIPLDSKFCPKCGEKLKDKD